MKIKIAINRSLGIPLVTQIRDQLVAAIASGHFERGDRLPTIRQLAEFLDINRNTVAQVYRLLEVEGYLITRAGGGTTVADALRVSGLHELVRQAFQTAESAGFSAREFAELAYFKSAQQPLRPAILVLDGYRGELRFLTETIRTHLPGSGIHGMLLDELATIPVDERPGRLQRFDFALVPFYCLEQVTTLLAGCDLPTLAAGVGPSLKVLQRVRDSSADKTVAIVCSEPMGPLHMERSLRRAGIELAEVRHAHLGLDKLADIVTGSQLVIASEGSLDTVRALAPATPTITYSAILSEESLATIRSYAAQVTQHRSTDPAGY